MAELNAADLYQEAAPGWAAGAELVYGPLADALVATSPVPLTGRRILDVGAGTGAGSRSLRAVGARPVAVDLVLEMLRHDRGRRPPAMVGDVLHLPVGDGAVDGVLAPFVLNHVDRPVEALRELARGAGPGGVVLASTFSDTDRPAVKELVDGVVTAHGWTPPPTYVWLKDRTLGLLGSAALMTEAAVDAGLTGIEVFEGAVPVGVSSPADLVAFRLGMAHVADYLARLPAGERAAIVADAEAVVAAQHDGSDLAPAAVFLAARVP